MGQAKTRLEKLGYHVTVCPEPSWVADLLNGSRPFDLAAVSSELDPTTQAQILRTLRQNARPTKLLLLLDELDSESMNYRTDSPVQTHRLTSDLGAFVDAVNSHLGVA
jgi:hypothetical protein